MNRLLTWLGLAPASTANPIPSDQRSVNITDMDPEVTPLIFGLVQGGRRQLDEWFPLLGDGSMEIEVPDVLILDSNLEDFGLEWAHSHGSIPVLLDTRWFLIRSNCFRPIKRAFDFEADGPAVRASTDPSASFESASEPDDESTSDSRSASDVDGADEDAEEIVDPTAPIDPDSNLSWVSRKHDIRCRALYDGKRRWIESRVDEFILYGEKSELELNFLCFLGKTRGDINVAKVIGSLGMIHRARKISGENAELYGLTTDTYTWIFVRVDKDSHITLRSFTWKNDKFEIVETLCAIMGATVMQAEGVRAREMSDGNVARLGGCRVWESWVF